MALENVTLDDKYALESGRIYLSGVQALVRLLLMQRRRDLAAGLNTAGFVSGYRGSPLGGLDLALWKARGFLDDHHIHFIPAVNEELAATAVWGSQQVNIFSGARYDGVFGVWYGKGPGADRSGDAFRHANVAGVSRYGGVLAVAGDDHACKSSSLPHQSEHTFIAAQMPVLYPADIQEILDLGLFGWALSRYCGCWVGFKTIAETVDSSASVQVDPNRIEIVAPGDFEMPQEGLHIRWPDSPLDQERRLHRYKLYAALAFARANRLNRIVIDSPEPRFGIVTAGKSYLDVMQALQDLGIGSEQAANIGLRVYKVGMVWPLERSGMREFARGLQEILVVEEKRAILENQIKEQLYNWREDARPRVIGKFDEDGEWILPSSSELNPTRIAQVIAARILRFHSDQGIRDRMALLQAREQATTAAAPLVTRLPFFCSGCPHNSSTTVPEGSRALAGIGCHYMAMWMDRRTETFTQMGGEGATWIGQAFFTNTPHVFQNLGDGTYFHSGLLAIRAAVAAKVNITYKILYNDAVAMTGGQPVDGPLTVPQLSRQLYAEGIRRIAVVSDDPGKYPNRRDFAPGVSLRHRAELDRVQRELREVEGVSALIYDQTCAAEKRRRRKRGLLPDPPKRVFINQRVCEGCGDCGIQSNCLAVVPVETEFGRKRAIDQHACNKDYSCLNGFCPSLVTVHGGQLRKPEAVNAAGFGELPDPPRPSLENPYSILIAGIGGAGVVTVGALLGMAAHLEGKRASVLDMTGLSQKFGTVFSHVRIVGQAQDLHAARIAAGGADLLLGCDLAVAAHPDALSRLDPASARAIVNSAEAMPGEFTRKPDLEFPAQAMKERIAEATGSKAGENRAEFVDAARLAGVLTGDSMFANLFLSGYAFQKGLIPLSAEAIENAIALNSVAVEANKQAFLWGRRAAHDPQAVQKLLPADTAAIPAGFDELVAHRADFLTRYQNAAYARKYQALVDRVRQTETAGFENRRELSEAVARGYAKLLAYKDEYEVARLYTDGRFIKDLQSQFEGDYTLQFHLAPPFLGKRDPATGRLQKHSFGPWMLRVFRMLAKLKWLRGTPLDPFGYSAERKLERRLIRDYEKLIDELLRDLKPANYDYAVELASLPASVRGFGHVKQAHLEEAKKREAELLALFRNPPKSALENGRPHTGIGRCAKISAV